MQIVYTLDVNKFGYTPWFNQVGARKIEVTNTLCIQIMCHAVSVLRVPQMQVMILHAVTHPQPENLRKFLESIQECILVLLDWQAGRCTVETWDPDGLFEQTAFGTQFLSVWCLVEQASFLAILNLFACSPLQSPDGLSICWGWSPKGRQDFLKLGFHFGVLLVKSICSGFLHPWASSKGALTFLLSCIFIQAQKRAFIQLILYFTIQCDWLCCANCSTWNWSCWNLLREMGKSQLNWWTFLIWHLGCVIGPKHHLASIGIPWDLLISGQPQFGCHLVRETGCNEYCKTDWFSTKIHNVVGQHVQIESTYIGIIGI